MKKLIELAREARENSYCPYSKFPVGSAVEMNSGNTYTGSNIENASYGLTICAERVAIFKAISSGESKIKTIAISCINNNNKQDSLMPCGACRQVISEFSDENTIIAIDGVGNFSVSDLLPSAFTI